MISKDLIGTWAGTIWHVLDAHRESLSMEDLKHHSGLTKEQIDLAIGWLARESKVDFFEVEGQTCLMINAPSFF